MLMKCALNQFLGSQNKHGKTFFCYMIMKVSAKLELIGHFHDVI